jgi:stage II sporulation protein R
MFIKRPLLMQQALGGVLFMKKFELSVIIGFILTLAISNQVAFAKDCGEIRDEVLRIHILANSNSQEDQQLKLKVRDRVLEESGDLFSYATSREDAKEIAEKQIDEIEAFAQDEIYKNGYDYSVHAEVVNMFFTTRHYENFTMPAGMYDAVRLTIGEAKGKNWWCVMFPPMCVPAATAKYDFNERQTDIMTKPKYEAEFAILEFTENIKNHFPQNNG